MCPTRRTPFPASLSHITQDHVRLTNRLPVRVEFALTAPDYPLHDHEFYEICLITRGEAIHVTQEGEEPLRRGSIIVVAPGQAHGFSKAKDLGLVNVYYLAEWFLSNLQALRDIDRLVPLFFQQALYPRRDPGAVVHFPMALDVLKSCLRDLEDLNRESISSEPQPLYLEASLIKCLVQIARAYNQSGRARSVRELPPSILYAQRQLERAAALGNAPNLRRLSQDAGVSFSHFCRLFKAATGMSGGAYFQRSRIHGACHRLLTTQVSATEIAYSLGYSDSAHFSRSFKSTTGLSPREYRKKFTIKTSKALFAGKG